MIMKVRQVSDSLALAYGEGKVNPLLTVISHWTKKIFDSPKLELIVSDPKDINSLRQLGGMKIVEITEGKNRIKAKLTKEGKDLYWDFMAKGYYGTS